MCCAVEGSGWEDAKGNCGQRPDLGGVVGEVGWNSGLTFCW